MKNPFHRMEKGFDVREYEINVLSTAQSRFMSTQSTTILSYQALYYIIMDKDCWECTEMDITCINLHHLR